MDPSHLIYSRIGIVTVPVLTHDDVALAYDEKWWMGKMSGYSHEFEKVADRN